MAQLSFIAIFTLLAISYGPAVMANPFIEDMGKTTQSLASSLELSPPGVTVEERLEPADGVAESAANVTAFKPKKLPPEKRYYYSRS